jgi:signal transduction protein with GAF and PtsI domain
MSFAQRLRTTLSLRDVEAAAELAAGASLEAILDRYLLAVEAAADTDLLTSILLLDSEGRRLLHGAAPNLPKSFCDAIHGGEIGPSAGTCGTAAFRKRPVYVADIATDPLWDDYRHLALPHGLRACWSTPIEDGRGRLLGTFAIYHLSPRSPTEEELTAVRLITSHVAEAISASQRPDRPTGPAGTRKTGRSPNGRDPAATPLATDFAMDPGRIWERMQQIERCRHRAEVADARATEGSPTFRREMAEAAQSWRELALEYELLFKRGR